MATDWGGSGDGSSPPPSDGKGCPLFGIKLLAAATALWLLITRVKSK